jgi:hypothetical protein
MRALRKGRAALFNLTHDCCGVARILEQAFGIDASAPIEAGLSIASRTPTSKS